MDKEVELVQCFFNPSHMIYRSRYPYHLQRCRSDHQHIKHKVCPYNTMHLMVPEEYDDHIRKCDSRSLSALVAPDNAACQPPIEAASNSWEEGAWGEEPEPVVPQNVQRNFIYAPLIGGSRSERIQHRLAGRREFNEQENSRLSREAQSNNTNNDKKKKKRKRKSRNSNSNSENVNNAPGNNPIPNNVGNEPLAERNRTASDDVNLAGLSLKD